MRGPAAEAVSGRVRRPHTTSTALRIRFFEELVQFKDPTVCLGHDLGATGDEVITQHFAPVQIQGKAAQVEHGFLAFLPQPFALAPQLPDGRRPLEAQRRLGPGWLVDVGGCCRGAFFVGVVSERLSQMVGIHDREG